MAVMTIDEILETIPHRYPMVMVDRVIECDDEKKIVAIKNVTINEPYFTGHFPTYPVMPGVLQLEAMAQAGGILIIRAAKLPAGIPYLMMIDKAKFRKVVKPGDQLRIEVELVQTRRNTARFSGRILVDDAVVSQAELMCMITKESAEE